MYLLLTLDMQVTTNNQILGANEAWGQDRRDDLLNTVNTYKPALHWERWWYWLPFAKTCNQSTISC